MTRSIRFPVEADGKTEIHAVCYPAGRARAVSRGDPAWAEAAREALRASMVFLPGISGRHFVRELEERQVPLDVALEYQRAARVVDEVYVTYRPGEEPVSRYQVVRVHVPD
jgi:hypothetical protein